MQLPSVQFLLFFTRLFLTAFHSGPIVTGTSVLAIKFNDGVMLAADCLGMFYSTFYCLLLASYGSLARFKDVQRIRPIGKATVLGCSGDVADFQHILQMMDEIQ